MLFTDTGPLHPPTTKKQRTPRLLSIKVSRTNAAAAGVGIDRDKIASPLGASRAMTAFACTSRWSCGIVNCMYTPSRSTLPSPLIEEGVVSAVWLRRKIQRTYHVTLFASSHALIALDAHEYASIHQPWDDRQELVLHPQFNRTLATAPASSANTTLPYLYKLSALLASPYNRTMFFDCDVFVAMPSLVHDLLAHSLTVADVAMPIDPGRTQRLVDGVAPWVSPWSGPPMLCSAVVAYWRSEAVDQLWLGAGRRLATGQHRGVRPTDQEAIWFEWTSARLPQLRVLSLPEEYFCPLHIQQRAVGGKHKWRTSWHDGRYDCRALHGHAYADVVRAQLKVADLGSDRNGRPARSDTRAGRAHLPRDTKHMIT